MLLPPPLSASQLQVAVIGRPNVGKSALFNRITGSNKAIVFNEPGVTRDRLYTRAEWTGHEFALVDTGGLMSSAAQLPTQEARVQASRDISAAGLPSAIERQAAAGDKGSRAVQPACHCDVSQLTVRSRTR